MRVNGKKRILALSILIAFVAIFGTYTWTVLNQPPKPNQIIVVVTPGKDSVKQGAVLPIYINATTVGGPYTIDGTTYDNGLQLVPVLGNGKLGGTAAIIRYNLTEQDPHEVVYWNVTEGYLNARQMENWLVPSGRYELSVGAYTPNVPDYVGNISFVFREQYISVLGINVSMSHNNTDAFFNISSSLSSPDYLSAFLTVSTEEKNTSSGQLFYFNFSTNVTVPENFSFSYKSSRANIQYFTVYYLKTKFGTITEDVLYGIFR